MDLKEKIFDDRDGFKKLLSSIPGYGGYQQKEMRRDADKLLREQLARQLSQQAVRLQQIKAEMVTSGQLMSIGAVERPSNKLQLLIDRIKTASYGYAGWFDSLTVRDDDLDALYAYDESMLEGVSQVSEAIDKVATAVTARENLAAACQELTTVLDRLNATFAQRAEVILR